MKFTHQEELNTVEENFMDMKKEELSDNVKAKWIETKRLFIGIGICCL